MERVILPDCCEDWILGYGPFYEAGAGFECIECGSRWRKQAPGRFERVEGGQVWAERSREAEGQRFRYLEAEGGQNAMTNRCCARLILDYGERIHLDKQFACPICGTQWKKEQGESRGGMLVVSYLNETRGTRIAVQKGQGRDYLVPFEDYTPSRY